MAHLVRPWKTYHADAAGRRVPKSTPGAQKVKARAAKWYAAGVPGWPKGKRVPLATDKSVARVMLADLVRHGEKSAAGMAPADPAHARRSLVEHLGDYRKALEAKDDDPGHVAKVYARVRAVLEGCKAAAPADLTAAAVTAWLAGRRRLPRAEGGFGVQTSNHYLANAKAFCRWMVRERRMAADPLQHVARLNPKADRRHARRPLTPADLAAVLDVAQASPRTVRRLTGPERAALYLTAAGTGFRVGELASLTPEAFALDADPPTVTVAAAYAKNRQPDTLPLPPGVARALRAFLPTRPAGTPVWPGNWHERAADMLKEDLEAAGIPYVVAAADGPLHADFHALRHAYITSLDRAGVSLKEAQRLARHSDPKLTVGVYTHATMAELGRAAARLPDLTATSGSADLFDGTPRAALEALAFYGLAYLAASGGAHPPAVAPRVAPGFAPDGDGAGRTGTISPPAKGRKRPPKPRQKDDLRRSETV